MCDETFSHFKVADLGVSRQLSVDTVFLNTFLGTPLYISPELLENKPYNEKTDMWSLGVILYELFALVVPFQGVTIFALAQAIVQARHAPLPSHCSPHAALCCKWLLEVNFTKRPSIVQLLLFVSKRLDAADPRDAPTASTSTTSLAPSTSFLAVLPVVEPSFGTKRDCDCVCVCEDPSTAMASVSGAATITGKACSSDGSNEKVEMIELRKNDSKTFELNKNDSSVVDFVDNNKVLVQTQRVQVCLKRELSKWRKLCQERQLHSSPGVSLDNTTISSSARDRDLEVADRIVAAKKSVDLLETLLQGAAAVEGVENVLWMEKCIADRFASIKCLCEC